MPSLGLRLRAAALFGAGALAVHQLRYLLAYGRSSSDALALQGHAYLLVLAPVVGMLVMLAAIEFLVRVAKAGGTSSAEARLPSPIRLWMLASGCLAVIYSVQEWLEGAAEAGHPGGLAGVFGHGGWIAILLSVAIGALIAMALRGATAVIELVARAAHRPPRSKPRRLLRPSCRTLAPDLDVLGLHLAARAPPPLFI
jgi:hypothetical protein